MSGNLVKKSQGSFNNLSLRNQVFELVVIAANGEYKRSSYR